MTNLKLTVIKEAYYEAVKEFCEFAKTRGYDVLIVDNGNIVFSKEEKR